MGNIENGRWAVSLKPDNKPNNVALKNANGQIRISQSPAHGSIPDSTRINFNIYPGVLTERMGWDAKFQGVWHTGPNIGAGTARLPFYGFGFGTINGQIP